MNKLNAKTTFWPVALLILVGGIIYANTLNVPFHFDDQSNIQNPTLRLDTLNAEEFREALSGGTLKTRPVSNLSFALNYFVGGYRVQGYHLVNIFIHVCTGAFLYLLVLATLSFPVNHRKFHNISAIALMSALLWLVHPLATQSVTYIVQRMNSMAAMFYILSMLLYVMGRNRQVEGERRASSLPAWILFVASGFSGLLAISSKENAATLPLFLFLYEWYFFQDLSIQWLKKRLYWLVGVFFIICGMAYIYTGGQLLQNLMSSCNGREFTTMERVLTEFRVIIHYISLFFYPNPDRLALDYDFSISTSLFSPNSTLYSLIAISALLLIAVLLARRERLISFTMLWFFGNLVIESSVICLEIIFEHRTYLSNMFAALVVVALLYRFGRNKTLISAMLVMTCTLLGYWTYKRNVVWQTPLALWTDSVTKHPNKARPHNNLGLALVEAGDLGRAETEYKRALEIDPDAEISHSNLAILFLRQGKRKEADFHFQEALRIKPDYVMALVEFGGMLRESGEYNKAAEYYRKALDKEPDIKLINKYLGNVLLRSGHPAEALPYLNKALSDNNPNPEVLLDLGESLTHLGRIDEAIHSYKKILDHDRGNGSAHYHLAILTEKKGLANEAIAHYQSADRLLKYPFDLKYDLGNSLFRLGKLSEAEKTYKAFLAISPSLAKAYNNLGLVFVNQGRLPDAVQAFQAALAVAPSFQLAADNLRLAKDQLKLLEEGAGGAANKKEDN